MEQYNLSTDRQAYELQHASPKALLSMGSLPDELRYELFIAAELYTLRMAYPVQARKFTEREVIRTNELWAEIFAGVDLLLMHKAVVRFIATDRKAFFPSPGQIIGVLEDIKKEVAAEEKRAAAEKHWEAVFEHERRVAQGENCSTCRFCEHRGCRAGRFEKHAEGSAVTMLFCQNPDSYKFEGRSGHGTADTILCEQYEPLTFTPGESQ